MPRRNASTPAAAGGTPLAAIRALATASPGTASTTSSAAKTAHVAVPARSALAAAGSTGR